MAEAGALGSLGINGMYLIGQIVSFGVLFYVLKKFLYQPILRKLDERAKTVEKGVKAAADSIELQARMEEERKQAFSKAHKEIETILAKAKDDGKALHQEMTQQAKADATRMIELERKKFDEEIKRQEKQLQAKMVDVAADMTKKILQGVLDQDKQALVINEQIKKLAK